MVWGVRPRSRAFGGCLAAAAFLALTTPVFAQDAPAEAIAVARALLAAFNAHDPDAMAELVTDDFELYYVDHDGQAALGLTGPDALRIEMRGYFEALPTVQSTIEAAIPGPRFVAFRERIVGGASSLAVYEISGDRVRRAWYYPSEG